MCKNNIESCVLKIMVGLLIFLSWEGELDKAAPFCVTSLFSVWRVQVLPNYSSNHVMVFFFTYSYCFEEQTTRPSVPEVTPQVGCQNVRCVVNFSSESFYTYYSNSFNSFGILNAY